MEIEQHTEPELGTRWALDCRQAVARTGWVGRNLGAGAVPQDPGAAGHWSRGRCSQTCFHRSGVTVASLLGQLGLLLLPEGHARMFLILEEDPSEPGPSSPVQPSPLKPSGSPSGLRPHLIPGCSQKASGWTFPAIFPSQVGAHWPVALGDHSCSHPVTPAPHTSQAQQPPCLPRGRFHSALSWQRGNHDSPDARSVR